jgi:hypothetical protein
MIVRLLLIATITTMSLGASAHAGQVTQPNVRVNPQPLPPKGNAIIIQGGKKMPKATGIIIEGGKK